MTYFKKMLSILVSMTLSAYCFGQNISPQNKLNNLDSVFNKILKDYHVSGFSVAVVHKDSVVYSKGFGFRDLEKKLPATPQTLYAIGSSTKAFTAALLGKLLDNGNSLDDKAIKYLPTLYFKDGRESQVTIRDLMTHRTGLNRYDYSWYVFNTDSRDSLLQRVKYMEPTADLRAKWQYNNFMYLAQGMVAEHITKKSWEENIKEQFLTPLSMKRTNFDVKEMAKDPDASKGYTVDDKKNIKAIPYFDIQGMGPAGSINSSVMDISQWLKLWIAGGKFKGKEILPSKYIEQAASSQMVISGGLPGKYPDIYVSNYGLGWMISSYRGHYQVEHGGNIDGFSASVSFFPSDQLGIVVLTNQNSSQVPDIIRNLIVDRWLGLSTINWNERSVTPESKEDEKEEKVDLVRVLNTKPSHIKADYTGKFSNPAYGSFQIALKNDSLKITLGKQHALLSHYHFDVFELREIDEKGKVDTAESVSKINFRSSMDGKIESAAIDLDDPSGNPVEFIKEIVAKEIPKDLFESYIGKYSVEGMNIVVTIKEGVLFVDVPGQTNYETIAQGDHNFNLKDLKGYSIRFEFDDNAKKASVLYFIQPNGTFKVKRADK